MGQQEANNKKQKNEVHKRTKYIDHSRRFLEWVDNVGFEKTFLGRIFSHLEEKFKIRRLSILFVFSLALSLIMFSDFDFSYKSQVGDLANADIKSPLSFEIVDEVATEAKRVEAEKATLPVFDYSPDALESVYDRTYSAFSKMREYVRSTTWPRDPAKREETVKSFFKYKKEFEDIIGVEFSNLHFEWLAEKRFRVSVENVIIRHLAGWSPLKIADSPGKVLSKGLDRIIIRTVEGGSPGEEEALELTELKDLSKRQSFSGNKVRGLKRFDKKGQAYLTRISHNLMVPNLTLNKQETSLRKKQARNSVLPVQISIKKNQTIVSAGTQIQPIHLTILNEIQDLKSEQRAEFMSIIAAFLFMVLVLVFMSYLKRFSLRRIQVRQNDYIVMAVVILFVVAMSKSFIFIANSAFATKFGALIPATAILYAVPVAAGPMLIGLLITYGEVVWLFTSFLGVALTIMVDMNFTFFLMSVIGGIAAARGVYGCEKRNDIYFAGLRTGGVNAIIITLMVAIESVGSGHLWHDLMWNVPAGFLGGVFSSLVAMMLIPLLESVFNYTTDVKLLELSNLNHPLMKEMIVKAPGTYHHCLSVGTMVEEAAIDIGANPLLAKVMAYYHDIGKMEHAEYFAENQRPGYNPHDHITPFMSKTILIAHVKDGAELGLKHKLGEPIIDGILQHHGTSLISYFYNKAVAESDEDIDHVEESQFRYPGPKPQFKEAALVMLADSIEAAARSIEEPTATRLTHLVKNIIQNKFIDGQLDECNLTLKDLSVIEAAFKKTLLSIYHQRIDYPHMKLGAPIKENKNKNKPKKNLHSVGNE